MKKICLSFLFLSTCFLLMSTPSWSKTVYVRDDGNTNAFCNGGVDAPYPGSGVSQPCAFNHPRYATGWGCGYGGGSCNHPGNLIGGDTLMVDGNSHISPGTQAKYMIGFDTGGLTPGCSGGGSYDCTPGNLPSGPDAAHPTRLLGYNWDTLTGFMPQFWGNERVYQAINANNSNIEVQFVEVTDHSSCIESGPIDGTVDGFPTQCQRSTSPYGPWMTDGIFTGGNNVLIRNVKEHGAGRYGINITQVGNITFDNVMVEGNGWGGAGTSGTDQVTGTVTWLTPQVNFNGCGEHYPRLTSTSVYDSITNFHHCWGQAQGGYGDGVFFGNTAFGNAGNWVFKGPGSISHNTQDGIDTLHGAGTGVITVSRIRTEGNAGNTIKLNALTDYVENNKIIGNCGWWKGNAVTSPKDNTGASIAFTLGDICRAHGDVLALFVGANTKAYLYNNTIVSNGNITILTAGSGCNAGTIIQSRNNIVYGGRTWDDDTANNGSGGNSQTTFFYRGGSDGNGAGTCGTSTLVFDEDYDIVLNTKNSNNFCGGAHSQCGVDPKFTGTFNMGPTTYYTGTTLSSLIDLQATSPAVNAGVSSLTYQNVSNDYNNFIRNLPFDIGGLELGSTGGGSTPSPNGATCTSALQCTNSFCCYAVCGSSACQSLPTIGMDNASLNGNFGS